MRLTVVSHAGKERTILLAGEGSFFGEGSLAGQARRTGSAAAMTDCELLRVDKALMLEALRRERSLADLFLTHLLVRNIRSEEDLVDLLFNSSERRLARVLLLLAHFGKDGDSAAAVPKISQQTLADMVGTTRSRVSFFMNRFRRMGFIQYSGGQNSTFSQGPQLAAQCGPARPGYARHADAAKPDPRKAFEVSCTLRARAPHHE